MFFNGALLATADYTETNSTTITLGFTPVASDQFRVIVGRAVNVTNVSRSQVGAALYPQTAAEIAAGVTPTDYGYAPGDVRRYGVTGSGDETAAYQLAINAAPNNGQITVPAGMSSQIGQVIIDGKNLNVSAYGATFTLVGSKAGFVFKGTITRMRWYGGHFIGDGADRDADVPNAQIGILVGNEAGANVTNWRVYDTTFESSNVGVKAASGTGTGSGDARWGKVIGCHAKNIIGGVGGVGYGFQFSQASDSTIIGSSAENCGRHGIYFAEGRNYSAVNCEVKNHRSTILTGAVRSAMSISRSRNVSVSNCIFDANNGGSMTIDGDLQGTAGENVPDGVTVTNCTFKDDELNSIRVGTISPSTEGLPKNVVISGCTMVSKSGATAGQIDIQCGENVKVYGNLIDGTLMASGSRGIVLDAADGAAYTKGVEIYDNTIITNNGPGIQLPAALLTGTQRARIGPNRMSGVSAEIEFLGGEETTTNNNLIIRKENGTYRRTYTGAGGADVTIPAGGVTALYLAPSGATTVETFSGGTEGQEISLHFGNGNTTIKATTIYTQGAVPFVSTAADTMRLIYSGSAWREVSRSVN